MTDERLPTDSDLHLDGADAPAEPQDAADREAATAPPSEASAEAAPREAAAGEEAEPQAPAGGEAGASTGDEASPSAAAGAEGAGGASEPREDAAAAESTGPAAATGDEHRSHEGEDRGASAAAEPMAAHETAASAAAEDEPPAASAEPDAGAAAPPAAQAAETAAVAPEPAEAAGTGDDVAPETEPPSEAPTAAATSQIAAPLAAEVAAGGGGVALVSEDAPQDEIAIADEAAATEAAAAEAAAPQATAEAPAPAAPAGEPATPLAESTPAAAPEPGTEPAAAAPEAAAEEPESPELAALREAREKGTPVEGRVIGWNRGGFHVVVGSVTAFCPSSEMEVGRPKSPASYVEKTFPFKVIKYQKKGRRVVLSRAAVLGEQRQEVLAKLTPGSTVRGRVTSLPDFGAFVDLGGVEGLVHVSEISRGRVQHPKDALQLGQEVEVKVIKVEQGGERISLSMKDLEPDPWRAAGERFTRGDRFSGKVLRKTEFGLFVELEPEVEGLLHVSQLPPGKTMDDEAFQPGQPIEGWVREVDAKRQRVSLSLREVPTDDPWKEIGRRFPEGESVEGTVESVAPFGVFITLGPGITGLLPNSQTGLPRGSNAARAFSPGQQVRVQVLSIDARRKRISLGREGARVEASKNDLQDFRRREKERVKESPTAMAAAFARLRGRHKER